MLETEELTADHQIQGLRGLTTDHILELAMLFFYEHWSSLATLLVILCKWIHSLWFVCTRMRNPLSYLLFYCIRTLSSLTIKQTDFLVIIEESIFFRNQTLFVLCFVLKGSFLCSHLLPKVEWEFDPFRDLKTGFLCIFELLKFSFVK